MTSSKRKLLLSVLITVFVLLTVMMGLAIAFALQDQTVKTRINMTFKATSIDGSVSGTYTFAGETEDLEPIADANHVSADNKELLFKHDDDSGTDGGSLNFPAENVELTDEHDTVIIQYNFKNNGSVHYMASLSFDSAFVSKNMKVQYGILDDTTLKIKYSDERYAVVVAGNSTAVKSYWIKISIANKAKDADFIGDFIWKLEKCSNANASYSSLTQLEFTGNNGSYSVSSSNVGSGAGGQEGKIVFPSSVNGDPVTTIKANNYKGSDGRPAYNLDNETGFYTSNKDTTLKSVVIPASVTKICEFSFYNCQALTEVVFEHNDLNLTTGIEFCEGVFAGCILLEEIQIPKHSTISEEQIFANCTNLKNVVLAEGITGPIGEECFLNCTSLTEIILPSSLTNTGLNSFSGCTLNTITIKCNVGSSYIKATTVIIEETCNSISKNAFDEGMTNLIIKGTNNWQQIDPTGSAGNIVLNYEESLADPITAASLYNNSFGYSRITN